MKRIISVGMFMLLSVIAFGQIQTPKMLQEIKCTPPQFTGVDKAVSVLQGNKYPSIEEYLMKNMVYPEVDAADATQGTEVVQFVITPRGDIGDIKIVNSVSKQIDSRIITILKTTNGMWKPGYNDDKPEAMEKEISLVFKISELSYFDFYHWAKKYFVKGNELLMAKSNPQKALKYYDKAMVLLPNDKALLVQRGLARYEVGNREGALMDWTRVRNLGGVESETFLNNFNSLKGYADLVSTLGK